MARISELHYSNAYAASSGVAEFLEVALGNGETPASFVVSFYDADGSVGVEIALTDLGVQVSVDPDNGETVYVLSADDFGILLTDPDSAATGNYEAFALTDVSGATNVVIDFYDIGGGTQAITALDGAAAGAVSQNLPVLVGPDATTTTLQFNQPTPDLLSYDTVNPGDTGIACFVAGNLIETPDGDRPVETLQPGDLVATRDNGPQMVRWAGRQTVSGVGRFAPVRISAGVLGAVRETCVSQQHRLLISGWQSELLFGENEILVPAKALVNDATVRLVPRPRVTYCHILLDQHEILTADGLASESFYPGDNLTGAVGHEAAEELFAIFPNLRGRSCLYGPTARRVQSCTEAQIISLH